MICRKCKSDNVNIQRVSVTKKKKKGFIYWCCFGWLIDLILWIFLTLPRLVWAIIRPRRTRTRVHSEAVCQSCGYAWRV